jgi:hypothetical protein
MPDGWAVRLRTQAAKAYVNTEDLATLETMVAMLDETVTAVVYRAIMLGYRIGGHRADELWTLVLTEHGFKTDEIERIWTAKDAYNLENPGPLDSFKQCGR